nr:immunoglobulin heavy chain junction region [Macaca mulatta]MOW75126.1 immunoglobulin heavy chain junction region [Macaca mulatta]MOW75140.1 immunoglobulin heavy chain junction region [Macaca mulatta]MOW75183.1 immunoglobulin heavy chain junction region [Macaca mulatta]MOW75289.1 immunoglobulin heavy chain junction region [Macaca mulatta]
CARDVYGWGLDYW